MTQWIVRASGWNEHATLPIGAHRIISPRSKNTQFSRLDSFLAIQVFPLAGTPAKQMFCDLKPSCPKSSSYALRCSSEALLPVLYKAAFSLFSLLTKSECQTCPVTDLWCQLAFAWLGCLAKCLCSISVWVSRKSAMIWMNVITKKHQIWNKLTTIKAFSAAKAHCDDQVEFNPLDVGLNSFMYQILSNC